MGAYDAFIWAQFSNVAINEGVVMFGRSFFVFVLAAVLVVLPSDSFSADVSACYKGKNLPGWQLLVSASHGLMANFANGPLRDIAKGQHKLLGVKKLNDGKYYVFFLGSWGRFNMGTMRFELLRLDNNRWVLCTMGDYAVYCELVCQ